MKTIIASIFLTVVGFSLTGLAKDNGRGSCKVDAAGNITDTCAAGFTATPGAAITAGAVTTNNQTVAGATTGFICTCNPDTDAFSMKDCDAAHDTYGKTVTTSSTNANKEQVKNQDSVNDIQQKIQDAQEKLTDTLQKATEDTEKLTSKYKDETLKRQQDAQNDQSKLQDSIRQQNQQITDMNGKLAVAQIQVNSAQNSYTAVVNANSVTMVRMKCMSIIRKWMKDNAVGSTIKGSISNTGSQQALLDSQWDACVSTEQGNAQANISNAQASVVQAQGNVTSLQSAITQATSALAQMNASATQQNQMQQQASTNAATSYQQQLQNAKQQQTTAQQKASQNIMRLNMQAMQINQRAPADMTTELDASLKKIQRHCCERKDDGQLHWKFNDGESIISEEDDGDEGTDVCQAKISTASSTAKAQQNQQIMDTLAPAILQSVGHQ